MYRDKNNINVKIYQMETSLAIVICEKIYSSKKFPTKHRDRDKKIVTMNIYAHNNITYNFKMHKLVITNLKRKKSANLVTTSSTYVNKWQNTPRFHIVLGVLFSTIKQVKEKWVWMLEEKKKKLSSFVDDMIRHEECQRESTKI